MSRAFSVSDREKTFAESFYGQRILQAGFEPFRDERNAAPVKGRSF